MEFHDDDYDHDEWEHPSQPGWDRGENIAIYEDGSFGLFLAELFGALAIVGLVCVVLWAAFALV